MEMFKITADVESGYWSFWDLQGEEPVRILHIPVRLSIEEGGYDIDQAMSIFAAHVMERQSR